MSSPEDQEYERAYAARDRIAERARWPERIGGIATIVLGIILITLLAPHFGFTIATFSPEVISALYYYVIPTLAVTVAGFAGFLAWNRIQYNRENAIVDDLANRED